MAQKDMAEKLLADYNDVFADIVNVLLFNGEEAIHEDDLYETKVKSQYKANDGKLHEHERDVAKMLKKDNVKIVLLGLENQTAVDADMPLRCLAYDGASYRSQMLNDKPERYPVITIVLYFGIDRWKNHRNLSETVYVPEIWKPYFNDYHAHIFEIAYLTPEQVKMFKSDFGIVADYFVQKRMTGNYTGNMDDIKHVDEMLKLLAVFADRRFVDDIIVSESKRRPKNMCEVIDRIKEEGRTEGFEEGFENAVLKMLRNHMAPELVARCLSVSVEYVKQVAEKHGIRYQY